MNTTTKKYYAAGVAAFVIWGFFSLPLRALKGYFVGEILYFRIFFSAIMLLVILLGFKRKEILKSMQTLKTIPRQERRAVIFLTFAGGALLIVNWLTFIYIVNSINVKTASFSYMICPVITAVLGYVLLKEKLSPLQWTAVALCAASCVMIGMSSALELGYSFLTAFTYALYLVSQRKNQGFDRLIVLGVQMLFAFVVLNFFYTSLIHNTPTTIDFYSIILIIAAFFTVLPLFLNLYALTRINSATIGILLYLNPIFNFTLALFVFNERVDQLQIIGYALIVVALVVFNYPLLKKVQHARTV